MDMRIRIPEVFKGKGEKGSDLTAYEVAKRSNGRIIPSTLYRISRSKGKVRFIDADLLEALCDVLDVSPGDLLERDKKRHGSR